MLHEVFYHKFKENLSEAFLRKLKVNFIIEIPLINFFQKLNKNGIKYLLLEVKTKTF